jgi:dipeptidyl aminopeptidase/acylaminoacyl peptidase
MVSIAQNAQTVKCGEIMQPALYLFLAPASALLFSCGGAATDLEVQPSNRLSISGERALTEAGPWLDPAWSPEGARISVAGLRYRGLHVVEIGDGARTLVPGSEDRSAFRHRWLEDPPRILVPARGRHAAVELGLHGVARELPADHPERAPVFVRDDDVWLRGDGDGPRRLTPGSDRFFDPQLSPDGALLAVVGLASGLHVVDVDSGLALYHAPGGTHPSWSPDGLWLLFERSADDGHALTEGDLWALSIVDGDQIRLTHTPDAIELHPAVSPDGRQLAYVRDGALWVAELQQGVTP